jgi:hypothetical protein
LFPSTGDTANWSSTLGGVNGREYPPSPVPADRDLWPGETPFTDWGQFGVDHLDLRVFDQDVWWVDRLGRPHRLVEMSEEYVANVILHLEENARYFYFGTMRRSFIQMLGDAYYGRVNGDVVAEALGAPTLSDVSPEQWLESTPLMRRLRRIARGPFRGVR